ncbi:hypothetical protein ANCCAN_07293 [Ancylostoma caninum]|uniref:G-protein coupled receptors family 1 profile domain-containing protein n=1 Tax=Ancylostoma caninum TaxID=29170 RepID=A0A368GQP6_ANCCA|nr:hypothetical protein ANCCAN_07293 [Ancylostoma caninum]
MRNSTYRLVLHLAAGTSSIMNMLLIFIYFRCPLKNMRTYKYGFILTAFQDLMTLLCILALIPRVISRNSYLMFLAMGRLEDPPQGQILLILLFVMMCLSLLIVSNNFIYRYIHVCKIQYSYIYTTRNSILIICAANIAVLVNCGIIMVACSWPSTDFRQQIYTERFSVDVVALEQKSFLGFSMEHSVTTMTIFLMGDGLVMMGMFTVIGNFSNFLADPRQSL